jgi:glycosyltransferase involved in cell wall biosynthesis
VRDVWPEGPIQQGYIKNKLSIRVLRWFERFIYEKSSYVVALSIGMKRDILSRVDLKNIEVIPNISEIERFKDFTKKVNIGVDFSDKKVVLYAGTLGPVNNLMYVAKLAVRLIEIEPKIIFLIVGDGKEKESIVKYCTEHQILNRNVFFHNPVNKEQLPFLYSQITMGSSFVWDYKIKWDNSANKFFDTLAAGRPILINYQGWQAEVIKKNNCGYVLPYYFDDDDVRAFADYLLDEKRVFDTGENARIVAEDYSLKSAVEKYIRVFQKLNLYD